MVLFNRRAVPRAVFLLFLLALAAWASRELPPYFDGHTRMPADPGGHQVEMILDRADRAGAMEYARAKRLQCDADLSSLKREVAFQSSLDWYQRDYGRAQRLHDEASADALRMYASVKGRADKDKAEAQELIARIEAQIGDAQNLAEHTSVDAYVRQRLASSEIQLKNAKALLAKGRYGAAVGSAREGLKAVEVSSERSRGLLARFDDPSSVSRWRSWVSDAVQESRRSGIALVVIKERHLLQVYKNGRVVRSIQVDLGAYSLRQKSYAGDRTTPEGRYHITRKKGFGQSKYGLALLLNYPNEDDLRRFQMAKARHELSGRSRIGGLIEIHGQGGRGEDWTDGCIAPSDADMAWLYNQASVGTVVAIVGSDGSDGPIRSSLRRVRRTNERPGA